MPLVSEMWLALSLALTMAAPAPEAKPAGTERIGKQIANFKLQDFRGAPHELDQLKQSKLVVVAFLGTECPLAQLYAARLVELDKEFRPKGVSFLGIDANEQDSITEIAHFASRMKVEFPVLKDVGNAIADRFGAERTPEVFVLDQERKVRYWGRIDDQYGIGYQRPKVGRRDLAIALEELLAGKPVGQAALEAPGCFIGRIRQPKADATVTYSNQVARIFQKRCLECHRTGEIAPFALTSYSEAAGWAETIREVVNEQRMPPWHANPEHGHFVNDARLTADEKRLINEWVAAGAPEGDPKQAPAPIEFTEGWRIGEPDLVISMPSEYSVPATGEVSYKYFVVDPGFTEDKWIKAAECKPGNRAVVHHIILLIKPPESAKAHLPGELSSDFLVATAPGARPLTLPDGMAKRVPAGSQFVFQMHYTPNGTAAKDKSIAGLVFADPKSVKRIVATEKAAQTKFLIPPRAEDHVVEATKKFHEDVLMLSMFPHTHLRGKSFRYEATYPDGRHEVLLDIPRYDFNWQNAYIFPEPKLMPKGTVIHCAAHYDNSENNPSNPNPNVPVKWGDQTWEEMMIGYFDIAPANMDLTKGPPPRRTDTFLKRTAAGGAEATDSLRDLARKARRSPEDFKQLGEALRELAPQLDRIDLITVRGDTLKVELVANAPGVPRRAGAAGFERAATGFAIADYARKGEMVVHQELTKAKGLEFRLLSQFFQSSLHVPMKIDGAAGCLDFWSREESGFPPEAVKLLQELAQEMADGK